MRADRLLAELNLLQVRGRMTAAELAFELEVTERTVYRDMYALQVAGVPLVVARGRSGGYSLFGDWRTDLTGLTSRELESLLTAAALAPDGRTGTTGVTAAVKLAAMLPEQQADRLKQLRKRIHIDPGDESDTMWATLIEAIHVGRALVLTLQLLPARRIDRIGHPIGLILDGRDWYLVWHGGDGRPRVGGRNEIAAVALATEKRIDVGPVDLAELWRDWAELRQSSRRRYLVRIRVDIGVLDEWRKRYAILEETTRQSTVEITAAFASIHEARAAVLPWGGAVEVISPRALRLAVADFAERIVARYSPD